MEQIQGKDFGQILVNVINYKTLKKVFALTVLLKDSCTVKLIIWMLSTEESAQVGLGDEASFCRRASGRQVHV